MALPIKDDLQTLDFNYRGKPFVRVEAKNIGTYSLDYSYYGGPYFGVGSAYAVWVKVSGVWKQATGIYVRVGGIWKDATSVGTKVAGIWKS